MRGKKEKRENEDKEKCRGLPINASRCHVFSGFPIGIQQPVASLYVLYNKAFLSYELVSSLDLVCRIYSNASSFHAKLTHPRLYPFFPKQVQE